MAKIGQLSPTFQPRNQTVLAPSIDVSGLARGLSDASQNIMAAGTIRDNARLQRSAAQASAASWEMKNFTNAFILNMNSPAKIMEAFGRDTSGQTPLSAGALGDVLAGLGPDAKLTDTTVFQSVTRNAIELIATGIEDDAMRDEFIWQQMNVMEGMEAPFQAQAEAFIQTEAAEIESNNQYQAWADGANSLSDAFQEKQMKRLLEGHYGADPIEARKAMAAELLNYQKAEARALLNFTLQNILIPLAFTDTSSEEMIKYAAANVELSGEIDLAQLDQDNKTYKLDKKAMNQIIAGGLLVKAGIDPLTQEETDTITDEWIERAMVAADLYDSEQAAFRAQVVSQDWREVISIAENTLGMTPAQISQAAETKINELNQKRNTSMGQFDSSSGWLPEIELGLHDDKVLNEQIGRLRQVVANGGKDIQSSIEGISAASAIILSSNGYAAKSAMLLDLVTTGAISSRDYRSALSDLDSFIAKPMHRDASRLYEQSISPGGINEDLSLADKTELARQIYQYQDFSGNKSSEQQFAEIQAILDDWAADREELQGLLSAGNADQSTFYRTSISGGKSFALEVSRNLEAFQQAIEKGSMGGVVADYAPILAEYTTEMSRNFQLLYENDALDMVDTSRYQLDADGLPIIVASVTDVNGRAMIAIALKPEDQLGRLEGTVRVAVVTPQIQNKRFGQIVGTNIFRNNNVLGFVDYGSYQDYMVTAVDTAGNPTNWVDENGDFRDGVVERKIIASEGLVSPGSQRNVLIDLSIDPNARLNRIQPPTVEEGNIARYEADYR